MKRYIIILFIFAGIFTSCNEFLDVVPEKNPSEGAFFATDKDATDAIDACYAILNMEETFGRDLFWEQTCGDDIEYGTTRGDWRKTMAEFNFTGRESGLVTAWNLFNEYLARANWVVYNLLKKEALTPVEKNRLGEAYFMRAFCHFFIAYRYGRADQGVPFDRYEDYSPYEYQIPEQRATVMENYRLIVEDMEKAADLLPFFGEYGEEDYGRAHKAAAWAYIVKTYAYWAQHDASKWDLIPALVNKIETEGHRDLLTDYADVFTIANNWTSEYIWSVNSSGHNYAGSIFPGIMLENKAWGLYNGWGSLKPTKGLYDEFDANDLRRGVTLLAYNDEFVIFGETRRYYSTSDLAIGFQVAKYMEPYTYGDIMDGKGVSDVISTNGDRPTTDLNVPIIRHAEMVLFKAEALLMKSSPDAAGAAAELNRLAKRAGLGDNKYATATMNDLKHERRCELGAEFTDRFMDLKRWGEWDKLNAAKEGRLYDNRSDPLSGWIVTEIRPARTFNPATDIVFPYNPDDVVKANGLLKQNPMD
ncbi:MAG: RagB/SusD family nutrient uptake outer membrane protein [Prevotellaceae bacterium]|jgi:hypothetical protein|nr:RagB/SusD family nutrient uptake outer membrane protein [Prevotellaceae bacterium]